MNPLRYNEEGLGRRTVASETACRTWLGLVHVDQLRRQTLRTTTSLVTRRFNSFAAPRRLGRGWLPGIEAKPVFAASLVGARRPRWTPHTDPRLEALAAGYELILAAGGASAIAKEAHR